MIDDWNAAVFVVTCTIVAVCCYFLKSREKWLSVASKSVLVTGCDSGIGFQMALRLDKLGFRVFAACLNPKSEGARRLQIASKRLVVVELDVTSDESVRRALADVKRILNNTGENLWAIINNAGVCVLGMFEWVTMSQIQMMYDINVLGTVRVLKLFLPLIRRAKGRVIIITSIAAKMPISGAAIYSSTKAALESIGDTLRMELADDGVKIALIEPGNHTKHTNLMHNQTNYRREQWEDMNDDARERDGNFFNLYHDSLVKSKGHRVPTPEETFYLVLKHVQHAVRSSHPRTRYLSASGIEAFVVRLTSVLPTTWKDKAMLTMVKKSWKLEV